MQNIFSAIKLAIQAGNPNPVLLSSVWTLLFDSYEDAVSTVKDNFTKKNYFIITKNGNKEYALTEAAFIKMLSIVNPSLVQKYNDSKIETIQKEAITSQTLPEEYIAEQEMKDQEVSRYKNLKENNFNVEEWIAKNTHNGIVSKEVLSEELLYKDGLKYLEFYQHFKNKL